MRNYYLKLLVFVSAFTVCINSYAQNNTNKLAKKRIIMVRYYENGAIKEKGKMKYMTKISTTPSGRSNGIMAYFENGRWTEYYENGDKKRKVKYKNGEIVKVIKAWKQKE
jgi:antitoxin component YwqK of YwqJK toxin-antitoxin module